VPPFRLQGSAAAAKVEVLASAPLFADAIRGQAEPGTVDGAR
jgi:hypothetical protein